MDLYDLMFSLVGFSVWIGVAAAVSFEVWLSRLRTYLRMRRALEASVVSMACVWPRDFLERFGVERIMHGASWDGSRITIGMSTKIILARR